VLLHILTVAAASVTCVNLKGAPNGRPSERRLISLQLTIAAWKRIKNPSVGI